MEYNYKGYMYSPWSDVEPEECVKIIHAVVTPDGKRVHIDWSPYSYLEESDFQFWVDLGCPTAEQLNLDHNFNRKDLEIASQNLALETEENRE